MTKRGQKLQKQDDAPTRIVSATLDLIAEKGSDALRTREILERAGVSNLSAINYYFGSLDNLRMHALQCYFDAARPVVAGLEEAPDPREALLEFCRRMARFVLDRPSLERNVVFLAMSGDPAASSFSEILSANVGVLQRLILRGRKGRTREKALLDAVAFASATIYPLLLAAYGPNSVGIDPSDEAQRERYFSNLVDRVLGPARKPRGSGK